MMHRYFPRPFRGHRDVWQCRSCTDETGAIIYRVEASGRWELPPDPDNLESLTGMVVALMRSELAEAEQAIKHCRRQVDRLRAEVERRQHIGRRHTQAQNLLKTLQHILNEHEANRDRLVVEVSRTEMASREG
jgi:predicted RNase H-like nuclease (RuvC/YqgF family)